MPVALITGGTRGIGLGIAGCLAAAKFDLVLNGLRSEKEVVPVLDRLRSGGSRIVYVQGDISLAADRDRMHGTAINSFGGIDVLVNNAGLAPPERKDVLELEEKDFDVVVDVNLKGTFFLTRQVARGMLDRPGKSSAHHRCIVFISSVSAEMVSLNRSAYCISKAGISMVSKLMAVRLAEAGIPVYEVRPGIIDTDMTAAVKEKYDAQIAQGLVPEHRWGTPDDVGRLVCELAHGHIPYSTGSVFHVDGGLTVSRL